MFVPVGPEGKTLTDQERTVAGNNSFALDLYARLREEEGNLFLSPFSISTALAMTYAGADGETGKQIYEALRFPTDGMTVPVELGNGQEMEVIVSPLMQLQQLQKKS